MLARDSIKERLHTLITPCLILRLMREALISPTDGYVFGCDSIIAQVMTITGVLKV
jgi:hypothetical protein